MRRSGKAFLSLISVTFGLTASAFVTIGCTSLNSAGEQRKLTIENTWSRMTTEKEFLAFRRMNRFSPIVTNQMIIQGNSIDGLIAYDRKTGGEMWRLKVDGGVEGGAQVAGDRIYFGASDGLFYCVSAANGKVLWSIPVRAETLAAPTVESGVVYFQSGTEIAYALDAQTGKQLWSFNRQVTGSLSIRATSRPVIAGETVLVGFSDGYLVALRKRDGALLWERKLGRANRFMDVDATPVVDGQEIFASSFDGALYSLKLESGEINWSLEEGAYVPVTLGQGRYSDRLYYSTVNGKIHVLDRRSGKALKTFQVANGIATQPVLFRNYLIYGESEGDFVVADPETGAAVTRFNPGHGLVARPSVIDGTGEAYFVSNSANLYALKISYRRLSERLPWQNQF